MSVYAYKCVIVKRSLRVYEGLQRASEFVLETVTEVDAGVCVSETAPL